jgi:8-amino-7-oxononanoate synthase
MTLQMQGPVGARTVFDGHEYDYFGGTGYLGLQTHPEVIRAGVEALQRYGLSTATSRGSYGEHPIYTELEREACAYFGAQKVIYFPSGYQGISVLTQASGGRFEHVFIDASAHFSLWDAAYATNRAITPFHHRRAESLEAALHAELSPGERPLVLSDGVFPISGEIAPLPDYLAVIRPYAGCVYLDDAHAVGVLGENGRGTPEYFGIAAEVCRTSGTLAKALGGYGGIIWGAAGWVDAIDRNSRVLAGASPPPLTVAAASAAALRVARTTPDLRRTLAANVAQARSGIRALGWDLPETPVPILCLDARDGVDLLGLKSGLFEQGIAVDLVRSYTSAPAGGCLRIALFATHTAEQIERLIAALARRV